MAKLYLFGNGLGMALDPQAYDLTNCLHNAWSDGLLNNDQKALITACLPKGIIEPMSEEHLGEMQAAVAACEILLKVKTKSRNHWLTSNGQNFPFAVKRYVFEVARQMYTASHSDPKKHNQHCELPDNFVNDLAIAVNLSKSHVATLNYDGLLSSAFEKLGLLGMQESVLRDGFVKENFARSNLFRPNESGGWYLHLHGSPLFSSISNGTHRKISSKSLYSNSKTLKYVGQHVVLTHAKHKMSIIRASEILDTYWEFLNLAVDQSTEILLFGYSGNDIHLNRLLSQRRASKNVRVVEWLGAGKRENRESFWAKQLGDSVELVQKEDVLTFSDW